MIRFVLLATFAGCLGVDGSQQPAAPLHDQVDSTLSNEPPMFAPRRALDTGAAATIRVIDDTAAAQGVIDAFVGDGGRD